MTIVSAGQVPHTIFRAFEFRDDALRWAQLLQSKGLSPVTMNCELIAGTDLRKGGLAEIRPDKRT